MLNWWEDEVFDKEYPLSLENMVIPEPIFGFAKLNIIGCEVPAGIGLPTHWVPEASRLINSDSWWE